MSDKRTIPSICQTCGKDFLARKSDVKRGWGIFCSLGCANTGKVNPHWKNGEYATPRKRAYSIAQNARKNGELQRQPCEECGSTRFVDGHHDDYNKPLNVRWLCRNCHKKEHARIDKLLRISAPAL